MKKISTSALAKEKNIPAKELFNKLSQLGYINKSDDSWTLTDTGTEKGGAYQKSQYGQYIAWPEDLQVSESPTPAAADSTPPPAKSGAKKSITSTAIGEKHGLPANKVNFILSELGWIQKSIKGWTVTEQGKKQGGKQEEAKTSGVPYVIWQEDIINNKSLVETIGYAKGAESLQVVTTKSKDHDSVEFREKFEAKHRTVDGHMVRSKAEVLIDNWLYMAEIAHAYERKLPIEEDVYCDFYIPAGKVYIEYWGYENEPKYLARKKKKIELYKKYDFSLIELQDKEVQNIDDILPRLLLKYGVRAY